MIGVDCFASIVSFSLFVIIGEGVYLIVGLEDDGLFDLVLWFLEDAIKFEVFHHRRVDRIKELMCHAAGILEPVGIRRLLWQLKLNSLVT